MVTAAAQVKPFMTGNEIKSNKKPAGDTMKQLITVVAEALEHKDGRDSHSGNVWLNRGSNICSGGKWLGCMPSQVAPFFPIWSLKSSRIL